MKQINMQW